MENKNIYFLIRNFVDSKYTDYDKSPETTIPLIVKEFQNILKKLSDFDFSKILITSYIPDLYKPNKSREKVYTKLVEVLVAEWWERLGLKADIITKKSGVEDIRLFLDDKVVVTNAKAYRLTRSQQAPNPKDFVKLQSIRFWMNNCISDGFIPLGGLIVSTSLHDWTKGSDVYEQCSNKGTPTVILHYEHLAYILKYKNNFNNKDIARLWNYDRLFPNPLDNRTNNKKLYWNKIISEIISITHTTSNDYIEFKSLFVKPTLRKFISLVEEVINSKICEEKEMVKKEIKQITKLNEMKQFYIDYKTKSITDELNTYLNRIKNLRKPFI